MPTQGTRAFTHCCKQFVVWDFSILQDVRWVFRESDLPSTLAWDWALLLRLYSCDSWYFWQYNSDLRLTHITGWFTAVGKDTSSYTNMFFCCSLHCSDQTVRLERKSQRCLTQSMQAHILGSHPVKSFLTWVPRSQCVGMTKVTLHVYIFSRFADIS